jgi:hypothetical protein
MESFLRPFRRRLAFIADLFAKLLASMKPQAVEVRSQRMCPSCGLITPRSNQLCLECGISLASVPVKRKNAT